MGGSSFLIVTGNALSSVHYFTISFSQCKGETFASVQKYPLILKQM